MPKVTYVSAGGHRTELELPNGLSLMEGAMNNNVAGIESECGGKCACATCHVYVDEAWLDKLRPSGALEDELLEGTASERRPTSRLSCQIKSSAALDGIVVHLPQSQS
ncbi:MAG: 2Fe-2S iron-sulfur cluster binding domain-containing protein [Proteobacteria bacterium]|nr:2Fe-2S iron-sulfur cluster binding domain-containing protein [Pseudomonadota bacterium]